MRGEGEGESQLCEALRIRRCVAVAKRGQRPWTFVRVVFNNDISVQYMKEREQADAQERREPQALLEFHHGRVGRTPQKLVGASIPLLNLSHT